MTNFFNKLKIPTLLGLSVIVAGIVAGVFLTLKQQIFTSQASPNVDIQNITVSNISDTEGVISWQTSVSITSFLTFGQTNPDETTVLDDRDSTQEGQPKQHIMHFVTLKNLTPKTSYQYKIIYGKKSSEVQKFTTSTPLESKSVSKPIIGSVLDGDKPLDEGIAYLSIADATLQSALVKSSGNFLIPTSQIRNSDLSASFPITPDTIGKLSIISPKGQTNVAFKFKDIDNPLPPIKLGQDLDLTNIAPKTPEINKQELDKYDLNGDGKINSADNAVILQNLGKNPKNKKADINNDGIVDQKDLDLLIQKIKDLGSQ